MTTFANRLGIALRLRKMTATELAKILNVSPATISEYRCGKRRPGAEFIVKVAMALDVTSDFLLGISNVFSANSEEIYAQAKDELKYKLLSFIDGGMYEERKESDRKCGP